MQTCPKRSSGSAVPPLAGGPIEAERDRGGARPPEAFLPHSAAGSSRTSNLEPRTAHPCLEAASIKVPTRWSQVLALAVLCRLAMKAGSPSRAIPSARSFTHSSGS